MPSIKKTGLLSDLRSVDSLIRFGSDLMKEERNAILSGTYDTLGDITARKIALIEEIENRAEKVLREQTTPERDARRDALRGAALILTRRASENQELLQSAIRGAERAREMISRIEGDTVAGFYGASGQPIPASNNARPALTKI